MMRQVSLCLCALLVLISSRAESVRNDGGWVLSVDADSGDYSIQLADPAWTVGGSLGTKLSNVNSGDGTDALGAFRQITFKWQVEAQRSGSIRIYRDRPVAIFSVTFDEPVKESPKAFPVLTTLPAGLSEFRYGEKDHLGPIWFKLKVEDPNEQYGGPFALFDDRANTMILSPASNFMVAMLRGEQKSGLSSGLNRTLQGVPAGYTHQTMLALGRGINRTWESWGRALTDLHAKKRPANDADTGLKYIGYWTDNGGHYYYNYELDKGYEGTLLAVQQRLASLGVPIAYMQLDSWWYPKTLNAMTEGESNRPRSKNPKIPPSTWNRYGGLLEYTPHPDLFPEGLAAFRQKLGAALITHNRWVDPESPYRSQYKISGLASIDPAWWEKIASDLSSWGVTTYEQDWLNYLYNRSPELSSTTTAGEAFMDGMASACARHNLTMQYCMVLPRLMLQGGAKYPNLTTIRPSGDRFDRGKWREFLYASRLPAALGVWPWSDVFRSRETGNMLVCNLSAGMVGLADEIGKEDVNNIFRVIRGDGVIVKPDVPITPIDATFIAEGKGDRKLIIATTHTSRSDDPSGRLATYLFAYAPKAENAPSEWSVDLAEIGVEGKAYAYDFFKGEGQLIEKTLTSKFDQDAWSYRILLPVGQSRMALIGDIGKFVTCGRQRVESVKDDPSSLAATLLFAPQDKPVTLAVYAPRKPHVQTAGIAGEVEYDAASQIARVTVRPTAPAAAGATTQVEVTFTLPQE